MKVKKHDLMLIWQKASMGGIIVSLLGLGEGSSVLFVV